MRFLSTFAHAVHGAVEWCLQHPLGRSQWLALGLWLGVLAGGMVALGGHIARTTNTDLASYDQGSYVALAERNRPIVWPTVTDGIRNPLFPWLMARAVRGTPVEIFETGRGLNVWCGALFAVALGVWAGRRMSWLPAMTFASISGLGILLPISTYVAAEALYYVLFFAAWWSALGVLDRPTHPRCALLGAVLALAYLAKPSVTLLCGSLAVVALVRWFAARHETAAIDWQGARPLYGAALTLAVAVPLILPRAVDSWRQFDDPFQNTSVNCFWEEDWAACLPQLAFLNPRMIHKIPAAERPSAEHYLARNGWHGAWERLTRGLMVQARHLSPGRSQNFSFARSPSPKQPIRHIFPYRGCFLLPPLVLALGLGGAARRRFGPATFARSAWFQAAFILLLTGASFGAFSWYAPIASGARFILALYIPVFGSLLCAAEAMRRRLAIRWVDVVCAGIWLAMLVVFLAHMVIIAMHPYFDTLKNTL